jgi:hypothetical protein
MPTPDEFLLAKEEVMDNLETLQMRISSCQDQGMLDPSSSLYNEAVILFEDAEAIETAGELEEIIVKAKEMEHNIDTWISLHGGSTMELHWPRFSN